MIEARQLVRRYGDFVAVAGVSFRIEHGEVVGLLGHNGAGKTTIMKMLTGYLEPSEGSVEVDGVDVERDPLRVQGNLGYLPENLPLYPELSIIDYLRYVADLRSVDASTAVPRVIDACGLGDKALQSIGTLSRGYRQRVGVAQAILHQPGIVILDEPTSGLDPNQTQEMRRLIAGLSETATVILSTHIMQEVSAMCSRALILRAGALVLDEKLEDLQRSHQIVVRTAAGAQPELIQGDGEKVVQNDAGLWTVAINGDPDEAADRIIRKLVAGNQPVYEVSPARRDLETLFREVNEEEH